MEVQQLNDIYKSFHQDYQQRMKTPFDDLSDEKTYNQHAQIVVECGNFLLAKEFKKFVVDDDNRQILRFLLYYFNNNEKAEQVFPERGYKVYKNLMICGSVGVGKTMLMQVFSLYLQKTKNPNFFHNLSVTQMMNYYKQHNHLDRYTYNETGSQSFDGDPVHVCLNDVGMATHLHFGQDTKVLIDDFFHARAEIWAQYKCLTHMTTNLNIEQMKGYFQDEHGRLNDRFKYYNVIALGGESKRG